MNQQLDPNLERRVSSQNWIVKHARLLPLFVVLLIMVPVAIGAMLSEKLADSRKMQELRVAADTVHAAISHAEASHFAMLSANALFLSRQEVSKTQFEEFTSSAMASVDASGMQGLGWARTPLSPDGKSILSAKVTYVAPANERNARAIGFDMYGETNRRQTIDVALKRGSPTATAPVVLAQEARGSKVPGFLLYMPVKSPTGQVKGIVYTAYQGPAFLASIVRESRLVDFHVRISDTTGQIPVPIAHIGPKPASVISQVQTVDFASRRWILEVQQPSAAALSRGTIAIILFGLLASALGGMFASLLVRSALNDRSHFEWQNRQLQIRDTLVLELNHRVKNTLANVLSIVMLTKSRANGLDDFVKSLTGRIRALSATHDLLTTNDWAGTDLQQILQAELKPYLNEDEGRVSMAGPPVAVMPSTALSLGLAVHEMATNSAKYGSLSVPEGRLQIAWFAENDGIGRVDWVEQNGPTVQERSSTGFGMDLLKKVVAHELGRAVDMRFDPDGLKCTIWFPMRPIERFRLRQNRDR